MLGNTQEINLSDLEALFNNMVEETVNAGLFDPEDQALEDFFIEEGEHNFEDTDIPEAVLPPHLEIKFTELFTFGCCKRKCLHNIEPTRYIRQAFLDLQLMKSDSKNSLLIYTLSLNAKASNDSRWSYTYSLPFVGKVCKEIFLKFWGYSEKPLKRCAKWMRIKNSILGPVHQNKENKHHHLPEITQSLAQEFLRRLGSECGEDRAIRKYTRKLNEGKISVNYEKMNYVYLPSHYSQSKIFSMYNHLHPLNKIRSRSAFINIWQSHEDLKKIIIRSPSKNECDDCTVLRINLIDATSNIQQELQAGLDNREEVVQDTAEKWTNHIAHYRDLRSNYEADIKRCRSGDDSDLTVLCFDYAQNVPLPHDPNTPSAVYFLSLLNVYQFGIVNEKRMIQDHYIYTEGTAGKGSNEVATMVMEYLDRCFIMTKNLCLWADNCGGQNKNATMIQLMAYLVLVGTFSGHTFESVEYKFQLKGHTRNSVDRGFGQVTNARKTEQIWTLNMYKNLINRINSNLCTDWDKETFYDWGNYLAQYFIKPVGIQKYQIFRFEKNRPYIMMAKACSSSEWTIFNLRKRTPIDFHNLLPILPLQKKGLNIEKQKDLYDKVRKFVPDQYKDQICPKPPDNIVEDVRNLKRKRKERVKEDNNIKYKSL